MLHQLCVFLVFCYQVLSTWWRQAPVSRGVVTCLLFYYGIFEYFCWSSDRSWWSPCVNDNGRCFCEMRKKFFSTKLLKDQYYFILVTWLITKKSPTRKMTIQKSTTRSSTKNWRGPWDFWSTWVYVSVTFLLFGRDCWFIQYFVWILIHMKINILLMLNCFFFMC